MNNLFEVSVKIIEKMFDIFGLIGRTLCNNLFFQILLGLVILSLLIGLVFYFIKQTKKTSRYGVIRSEKNGFYTVVDTKTGKYKYISESFNDAHLRAEQYNYGKIK